MSPTGWENYHRLRIDLVKCEVVGEAGYPDEEALASTEPELHTGG